MAAKAQFSEWNSVMDFEFPYQEFWRVDGTSIYRPIIPLVVRNPMTRRVQICEALVDTGADRCAFPLPIALSLGIDPPLQLTDSLRLANGDPCPVFDSKLQLELPTGTGRWCVWNPTVSIFSNSKPTLPKLGSRGMLELFNCNFDASNSRLILSPTAAFFASGGIIT